MRPHLLKVLLAIFREEGGKGAFLCERVSHVPWFELIYLPVVNGFVVPGCTWGEGVGI